MTSVSGEISAGVINAGLGVVRGLKDAWQDSDDKRRMKKAIDEIVFDKNFMLHLQKLFLLRLCAVL